MPARDTYHYALRSALESDGWKITDDPLTLKFGETDMYVDLGAEKLMIAEKDNRKIAVELKSFVGASVVNDLENACGQYFIYLMALKLTNSSRTLYLAVSEEIYDDVFERSSNWLRRSNIIRGARVIYSADQASEALHPDVLLKITPLLPQDQTSTITKT